MKISIEGLDAATRKLEDLSKRTELLDGEHHLKLQDLFPPPFLRTHSNFNSIEELLEASGFEIETQEDFESIPNDDWDEFIASNSDFELWEEMLQTAAGEWASSQLGLG